MEKIQIDKLLGGIYNLPGRVTLMDFLAARAPELAALNHAIENAPRDKPINSKDLPMHMKRTLMSHNQHRLPRRVLEAIKKDKIKKPISEQLHNIRKSRRKLKNKNIKKNSSNTTNNTTIETK